MIIGHLGVAFATKRRWQSAPMGWLLGATFAPDIWRLALAGSGYAWWPSNTLSHALPWSAIIAVVLASIAWLMLRDATITVLVALLVASHVGLDMVSGWKPLWIGGPNGLNAQRWELLEFLIEGSLVGLGWYLLRSAKRPGWLATRTALALMLAVELAYLQRSYYAKPVQVRCVTLPFARCSRRLQVRTP